MVSLIAMYSHRQTFVVIQNFVVVIVIPNQFFLCLAYIITLIAFVAHQEINNIHGITVTVSKMYNMACSRNVDFKLYSDDVADLAFWFIILFIICRYYSIWKKLFF